jgi:hypothetical protein
MNSAISQPSEALSGPRLRISDKHAINEAVMPLMTIYRPAGVAFFAMHHMMIVI